MTTGADGASIFDEVGKAVDPKPSDSDAPQAALDRIAKALVEKDPSLTYAQAMAKAVTDNPALYAAHRAANPNKVDADR